MYTSKARQLATTRALMLSKVWFGHRSTSSMIDARRQTMRDGWWTRQGSYVCNKHVDKYHNEKRLLPMTGSRRFKKLQNCVLTIDQPLGTQAEQ